jgi:hypothetical protein
MAFVLTRKVRHATHRPVSRAIKNGLIFLIQQLVVISTIRFAIVIVEYPKNRGGIIKPRWVDKPKKGGEVANTGKSQKLKAQKAKYNCTLLYPSGQMRILYAEVWR